VRLLMRLPLLRAYAHLEWNVDLTHRLIDSARLPHPFVTKVLFFGTKGWEMISRRSSHVPLFQPIKTTIRIRPVRTADSISHPFTEAEKSTASFRERIDWIRAKAPVDTVFFV